MPELPDLTVYIEALDSRIGGTRLKRVEIRTPFLLRTVEPPPTAAEGQPVYRVDAPDEGYEEHKKRLRQAAGRLWSMSSARTGQG